MYFYTFESLLLGVIFLVLNIFDDDHSSIEDATDEAEDSLLCFLAFPPAFDLLLVAQDMAAEVRFLIMPGLLQLLPAADLLALLLAVMLMLLLLVSSVASEVEAAANIQGCERISSRGILAAGWTCRHCLTRSRHSAETRDLKWTSAEQICSSCSKGMSPQTMSYRRMPRDQTVAVGPW